MAARDDELAGAWQAHHGGDVPAARTICERLLAADGDDVAALFLAGLINYECGDFARAVERLSRVVQLRPGYAEAHNNLGNALAALGQLGKAEQAFRQALRRKRQYPEALNNLANTLRDQRRLDEGIEAYRDALALRPDYADCHNNLGIALARKKQYDEAIASYHRALQLSPTFAEPHNNLGIALAARGRRVEAVDHFRRALDLKPGYVDAQANMALTLSDLGKLDDAVAAYQRAVELAPRSARLHNGLGIALAKRGDLNAAVDALRSAIEIDAGFAEAHNNLGNALRELGRPAEAEEHLRRALTLRPGYPEAHNNLGIVLIEQRRATDAVAAFDKALRQRPNYAEAHLNRALAWLAAGDFRRGWPEYEWRWRTNGFHELKTSQPRWDGGLIDGKTILLWTEQGPGDTFQFIRYAQLVRQRGARVLVRAPSSLHPLLSRTPGIDRLLGEDEDLPPFDCHVPLLGLPRLFATTLDCIPRQEPYLFADERLAARWGGRLRRVGQDCGVAGPSTAIGHETSGIRNQVEGRQTAPDTSRRTPDAPCLQRNAFLIGIALQDNPRSEADRHRSLPLSCLLRLAEIPGVQLVSLPKGPGTKQIADQQPNSACSVFEIDADENAGAFMDTAAVMANLDLVITADTAHAHLAGAMGVPVDVLLPRAADWRWLIEGDTSPWYSTMRLLQQAEPGNWQEVVERLAARVADIVQRHVPERAIEVYPQVAGGWIDRGVQLAERGELDDAVRCFRRALRFQPEFAEAYNNLGNALRAQGKLAEAIAHLDRALAISPDYVEARHNLGIALTRQRRREEALEQFQEALRLNPEFTPAWTSLGLLQADLRRYEDAEKSFRRALEIDPQNARVLNNLGNVLSDQGRREEAVGWLRRAIEIDAKCVDAYNNLGNALRELGQRDEAIASFERALAIRPAFPEAHNNLGITWAAKGDYPRAIACYQDALRIWPEYPAAHNNLGIALGHEKKFKEAIASYRRALELSPDYAEAHNNLGIALSQEGDYDEAIAHFHQAIELKPAYAEAYSNLGITLTELGRLDESLESYNEALRLKENYPDACMNRALAFLVRGDFERGWREYESRWQCKDFNPRNFKKPRWEGEPLEGRRILLHAEQGFGDTFQFLRYARLVKEERGGSIIAWVPRPLVPIVSQCPYVDEVTIEGDKLPEFDVHLPLLSMPKIFGTTLANVPNQVPYLYARPELIEQWCEELSYIDAFRIGINWQGNPRYRGDRHRSVPLEKFAPLAKIPGVRLVSLQKGFGTEQIDRVAARFSVTQLGAHRDEAAGAFMDTAAVLINLDLIVSSDTSLVHLAGGLGVPIWMALPWAADWRWLLDRDDCPWYPTMRLFRQNQLGEWDDVFQRIAAEAARLVERRETDEVKALRARLRSIHQDVRQAETPLRCDQLRAANGRCHRIDEVIGAL